MVRTIYANLTPSNGLLKHPNSRLLTANKSVDEVVIETLCTSKAREVSKLYDKNDAVG